MCREAFATHFGDLVAPRKALKSLTPSQVPGRVINLGYAGFHGMGGVCQSMGANC